MVALGNEMAASEDDDRPFGPAQGKERKFVVALARGLEVLRAFRARDGFLGNHEIAERTGLPRPTVSRLTYTLCELGYLMQVPRIGKYQLAPQAITLGYSALASLGIRQISRRLMDETAETLAAPIALGVLDRNRALYIDISRGSSTFTVQLEIGSRIPLPRTAMGMALLAGLTEDAREAAFARLSERFPDEWPALRKAIGEAIEHRSRNGFVISMATWRSDINAVGVPLVAADGSGVFAFNCGGPPEQFTPERMNTIYGPTLVRLARDVDRSLSGEAMLARQSATAPAGYR